MCCRMDILSYRKKHGLSQSAFAALLTEHGHPATQSLVSQWETGAVTLTADWCRDIERVTEGECTRLANRPDLFGELAA
jgi:DNA-binding transcriptional regulator YdaS (Cro superfamily)